MRKKPDPDDQVRHPSRRWLPVLLPVGAVVVGLLTWELVVKIRSIPVYIVPAPSDIVGELWTSRALLLDNLRVTALEIVGGFALGFATATLLGMALAYSRLFRRAALPLLIAWKAVPTVTVAPLLILWFGYQVFPKMLITSLVCFFPMTIATVDGLRGVDPRRTALFVTLGASWWARFRMLDVPSALPSMFTGVKIAVPLCVIGATISEWVGATSGLGQLIINDTGLLNTPRVFASIAILATIGIALYAIASLLEHLSVPWSRYGESRR